MKLEQAMKSKSSTGFSLVELLIVIAIITIAGTIAVPNFNAYRDNRNLREAVAEFMNDLQFAKQSARSQNVNYTVKLTTGSNSNYRVQGGTYDVTKNVRVFGGGSYINFHAFPSNKITFLPRGTLAETGGPYRVGFRNRRESCIHVDVYIMGNAIK
jgi:prepilin-type N-terminal cleavage/methylation domain-containing protein